MSFIIGKRSTKLPNVWVYSWSVESTFITTQQSVKLILLSPKHLLFLSIYDHGGFKPSSRGKNSYCDFYVLFTMLSILTRITQALVYLWKANQCTCRWLCLISQRKQWQVVYGSMKLRDSDIPILIMSTPEYTH